jgi:hypothetical protein
MLGSSRVAAQLVDSQKGFSSMSEYVSVIIKLQRFSVKNCIILINDLLLLLLFSASLTHHMIAFYFSRHMNNKELNYYYIIIIIMSQYIVTRIARL